MEAMDELKRWLAPHGLDDTAKLDENDPRKPIVDAARYLRNNRGRMDYPHYRRLGLPVTSALMESLVKEVNVPGEGDGDVLERPRGGGSDTPSPGRYSMRRRPVSGAYLRTRPGCAYVRRSTVTLAA